MSDIDDQGFEPITCASSDSLDRLLAALGRDGFEVVTVDGSDVNDKSSFLRRATHDIPGPDDAPTRNWDAFADWLWQAMSARADQRVAIVWTDAQVLLESSLTTLFTAVGLITDVAKDAEAGEGGFADPMEIVLCLVGTGPMFPTFRG